MKKKFLAFSLALVLLTALLKPSLILADSTPQFTLSISNNSPIIGSSIQVEVKGTQLNDLYAYELNLSFDDSRLQFVSAVTDASGYSVPAIIKGNTIQLAHSLVGAIPGKSGSVTLATLSFKAIILGGSSVGLTSLKLVNSELIATDITSSEVVAATVISGNGGGQSATPTSPSPTIAPESTPKPIGSSDPITTAKPVHTPEPILVGSTISVNPSTGAVTSTIDAASLDKAFAEAKLDASGKKQISIEIEAVPNAKEYVQHLPAKALSDSDKPVSIEIKTAIANITIPSNMFKQGDLPAGDVGLVIAQADISKLDAATKALIGNHPVIELSVQSGDHTIAWNNPSAPVAVSIAYSPTAEELLDPEHIVIWYIDGQGKVNPVVSGKYVAATGRVNFNITHFSTYAVAFVKKSFADIATVQWAKKQIEVLASKGIVNGLTATEFKPSNNITRADFLVLLVRTLELNGAKGAVFSDVRATDYYNEALQIARGLGIAEGSNNQFRPLDSITRQDMMVLTARAMQAANRSLDTAASNSDASGYKDNQDIAEYAKASVNALIKSGLVHGFNNQINPKATTTRAESVVLLYNLYNQ